MHGEAWLARQSGGVRLLLALGVQGLVAGSYHVDVADVNMVDRQRGWIGAYARVGIGYVF